MAMTQGPGSPTQDERLLAAVAHGLTFVEGGIIGPLIVYLWKKDESPFIAFHALQSLYFGLLAMAIILPATLITCGVGVVLVIPYLIAEVLATIAAHNGEWYELPLVGAWARQKHPPPAGLQ